MPKRSSIAPGKLILSGEYAVVFGYPGIAVPTAIGVEAVFETHSGSEIEIECEEQSREYTRKIVGLLRSSIERGGNLSLHSNLPFAKGMGSSTAFVIAITRALVGENEREKAKAIEEVLNPGGSGIDFETIWENAPMLFKKNAPSVKIPLPKNVLQGALLLDTGLPNESTAELIVWVRTREKELKDPLESIGKCTERLLNGEPFGTIVRDHHRAQVVLGVVPPVVQAVITEIESADGAAKVVGAGARTGGAGIVLALGNEREIRSIATKANYPVIQI